MQGKGADAKWILYLQLSMGRVFSNKKRLCETNRIGTSILGTPDNILCLTQAGRVPYLPPLACTYILALGRVIGSSSQK